MKDLNKTLRTYTIGFILSIILTIGAYLLVTAHINSYPALIPNIVLIPVIIFIALIQLAVQLIFFLHLGEETHTKWNAIFFLGTFSSVVIVIIASVWIMNHLNYNMSPNQVMQYIQSQSGI